jgi:diguanylate cyclase (GGDEF)-like protein/putative nucleotidyltransferase with HDIG domain
MTGPTANETARSRGFINLVSAAGLALFVFAVYQVGLTKIELELVLLCLVTALIVPNTDVQLPRIPSTVTLDDTFIYICFLLYGQWPAVLLAGITGVACSLNYTNKRKVIPFNAAVMSLSFFLSSSIVNLLFGEARRADASLSTLILVTESLALVHYLLNSGMVSAVSAFRRGRGVLATWRESFLWTSISYFAGAVAACLVVQLIGIISFYAFIIAVPILGITYLTYRSYLDRIRTSMNHVDEMGDLHLRTIEALAIAIDAKDEVTHDHVHRVQIYATGLARLFGLSDAEVEALKAGALLHDIGKLAVPDYILNKPDKLSPAEFDKMKSHTTVGADILSRVGFPYPVVPVVRHHHERWDGNGYPDGLRGDEIPITARILSVVDCFDAVREDRQYRKSMTRSEAITLLEKNSGSMYDPEVVRVFLAHLPEFEAEIALQKKEIRPTVNRHTMPASPPRSATSQPFEQIRNAHREVITLYEIAQTIGTTLDLRDMFAVFSSRLRDMVNYTTCVLYLRRPNSIEIETAHATGRNTEQFKGKSMIIGAGITGWVVANRQPMYNCDPTMDLTTLKVEVDEPYRSEIVVPLVKDNEALGALALYSTEVASYEPDHLRLAEAVAKLASDAIANALHHESAEAKALTDSLTGLSNARALRYQFEEEVDLAERHGTTFTVLMMDLDGFKRINDTLGHQAGDELLREVARVLFDQVRTTDFLCRYAGDEFVALVQVDSDEAREVAQRIQKAVDTSDFGLNSAAAGIGISIGWASYGPDGSSLDKLLLAADRAMYIDKFRRKSLGPAASDSSGQDRAHLIM